MGTPAAQADRAVVGLVPMAFVGRTRALIDREVGPPGTRTDPEHVIEVLARLGKPEDLVSLQVFVTAVAEYKDSLMALGAVWRRHFGRRYPAMGLFGVTELYDPAAKVELMGVAVVARGG